MEHFKAQFKAQLKEIKNSVQLLSFLDNFITELAKIQVDLDERLNFLETEVFEEKEVPSKKENSFWTEV